MMDDISEWFAHAVRRQVVAHEPQDIHGWIALRTFGKQGNNDDIRRGDLGGDLRQLQVDRFDVAQIMLRSGSWEAFSPSDNDLLILSDARFIGWLNLYTGWRYPLFLRDLAKARWEPF